VFYFPGILVGPTVEYVYYEQLVSGQLFVSNPNSGVKGERKRVPEGRKRVAYTKLLLALVFLGFYAVAGPSMDYTRILEPAYLEKSFFSRWVVVYFSLVITYQRHTSGSTRLLFAQGLGLTQRTKYYGVWLLTEV
jgi:lysophospholipid acyltransferase